MTEPRKTPRTRKNEFLAGETSENDPCVYVWFAEQLEVETQELAEELQNIADAKPSEWGDESDQFQAWAQNRARHALARHRAKQGGGNPE